MAKQIKLTATARTVSGSAAARRLRRQGLIPGVLNDEHGRATMIQLNRHDFEMMLHGHASANLIIDLEVDGTQPKKVLLKDVQHDFVTGDILHADFLEVSMTKKMRISVPVRLVGEPVGVAQEGGVLEHPLRTLEVECLPGDLPEEIVVDVSRLKIGQSLLVRDLKVDAKVTIVTSGDAPVASVSAPRAEEVPQAAEAAATAEGPQEPELVGAKGKAQEEESEEASPEVAPKSKEPAKEKSRQK